MTRKVTLTIPDDLGERLDQYRDRLNQSAVFARAIQEAIESLERQERTGDLGEVIERLRPQFEEYENRSNQFGYVRGVEYAKGHHNYLDLKNLGEMNADAFVAEVLEPGQTNHQLPVGQLLRMQGFEDLHGGLINKRRYLQGWITGVQDVWKGIRDGYRAPSPMDRNELQRLTSFKPHLDPRTL